MAEHNELGEKGEALAIAYLRREGLEIVEVNWRYQKLEVDIICRNSEFLIFVEVKTRNTDFFGTPDSFVGRTKQLMMAEAADAYLYKYPCELDIRYDIVSILLNDQKTEIRHIQDAFFPDNLGLSSFEF